MSKRARQFEMFGTQPSRHGGQDAQGKRKVARPVATKKPMHLTLRASRATGRHSMLSSAYSGRIRDLIFASGAKNQVKIEQFANVGNHLHLLIRARTRDGFRNFLRTVGARVAVLVTGAVKGRPFGKFWDHLAFSRIVEWGRDLLGVREYFTKNLLEGEGLNLLTPRGYRTFRVRGGRLQV